MSLPAALGCALQRRKGELIKGGGRAAGEAQSVEMPWLSRDGLSVEGERLRSAGHEQRGTRLKEAIAKEGGAPKARF